MDDLENLEFLSLVSKITSEIHNHLGLSDKTLAEFIIDQHSQCKSLEQFKEKLESLGADFPNSLIGKFTVSLMNFPSLIANIWIRKHRPTHPHIASQIQAEKRRRGARAKR